MNPDGGGLAARTAPGEVESQPQWAPTGNLLVFVTTLVTNVGNNDEVCTGSAFSSGALNISRHADQDSRPAWRR